MIKSSVLTQIAPARPVRATEPIVNSRATMRNKFAHRLSWSKSGQSICYKTGNLNVRSTGRLATTCRGRQWSCMILPLLCALGFEDSAVSTEIQHTDSYSIPSARSMETPSNITPPSPLFDTVGRIALRHFPQEGPFNTHRMRDYGIAVFTFFSVAIRELRRTNKTGHRSHCAE